MDVIAAGIRASRFAMLADVKAEHERLVLTAWFLVHGLTLLLIDGLATEAPLFVSELVTKTLLDGIRRR
ncbi:hypothetical protein [Acidiphilium sp. MT5]